MANKVIKLPDEQVKQVKDFQEKMVILMNKLGDIQIQRHNLDLIHSDLIKEYETFKLEERGLIKQIEEKYGIGRLDMKTGQLTIFENN